jgi:C4-dicarboxylate-specific signal transduction histidine kinase
MLNDLVVMYVEDEQTVRDVVESVLGRLFKQFYTAKDGREGLELFRQNSDEIQMVITDINMPNLNGLDMCTQIKQINENIPIIITTAHNEKEFLHNAIKIGVSAFVTKPMDMKFLLDTINSVAKPIILQQKLDQQSKLHMEERLMSAKFTATGQLAAGITHEINTPLTYVKASMELMQYDIEDLEESKIRTRLFESLEKVMGGLKRIETIVSSMKEIAQTSHHNIEDINIYSTVVTATTLAYNKIKHCSEVYINGEKFFLEMDKNKENFPTKAQLQRIEQVWIIVINNALDELIKLEKFEDRRLDITITQEDMFYVVKFQDNAGGISPDILPHLFEPFKGTKTSSGMGVGLSIAKKIIDDQNGYITGVNEGNGAVFTIKLPILM